jgi:tripartite-type tricarboxylate transporter receptor subunit TctC
VNCFDKRSEPQGSALGVNRRRAWLPALLAASLSVLVSMQGIDARADDFYRGKQITFVVSGGVGGGYDASARLIAQYLPKHIPGEPTVVVQNQPGAGGLNATNLLYNVAPRDGLTIGMINNTLAFDPLYGNTAARFDAMKFNWIGSPSQELGVFIVWHTVPVNTIEGARKRRLVLSATGTGSTPAFFARTLASIFDLNIQIVPGYKALADSFLGMEREENDGQAAAFWSSLTAQYPSWISDKKIKVLVYFGAVRNSAIPGPYFFDLVRDPGKRSLMQVAQAGLAMGKPMLTPPGVDQSKVAVLRAAMEKMFKDPAYLAQCAKARLDCASPSRGEDLLALIKKTYAEPKGAVEKISAIYREGRKK